MSITHRTPPLFSVIIPTLNRPDMLRRAINSVMTQTLQDFEIIVVDDGSHEPIKLPDDVDTHWRQRVRIITNECNKGVSEARNIGIRQSSGKYISFLDDDDEYFPNYLACTAEALVNTPIFIGFSWTNVITQDDSNSGKITREKEFQNIHPGESALLEIVMSIGTGYGITVKADCFSSIGYFDNSLRVAGDTDLLFRLLIAGFRPILVPIYGLRQHDHGLKRLSSPLTHAQRLDVCDILINRYEDFLNKHPKILHNLLNWMNVLRIELKQYQNT